MSKFSTDEPGHEIARIVDVIFDGVYADEGPEHTFRGGTRADWIAALDSAALAVR